MEVEAQKLIAIPSLELPEGARLPFDLFVRLPVSNRVILYRREGSSLNQEQVERVSVRELVFFVPTDQYGKYLNYATGHLVRLLSAKPPDTEALQQAAARVLGSIFAQSSVDEARQLVQELGALVSQMVVEISVGALDQRGGLFSKFAKLAQSGTDFQRHPLHVASLTVMMTLGLGVHDQRTLIEVGLAALLHDVGLTQLPMSVIGDAHKFHDVGTVTRSLLKMHPKASLDLLRARGIPASRLMTSMILQHHEEFSGQGYPQGLSGTDVHPLAQVLHFADDLDDLISQPGEVEPLGGRIESLVRRYERDRIIQPSLWGRLKGLLFS